MIIQIRSTGKVLKRPVPKVTPIPVKFLPVIPGIFKKIKGFCMNLFSPAVTKIYEFYVFSYFNSVDLFFYPNIVKIFEWIALSN